jgi:hypothetical protein
VVATTHAYIRKSAVVRVGVVVSASFVAVVAAVEAQSVVVVAGFGVVVVIVTAFAAVDTA